MKCVDKKNMTFDKNRRLEGNEFKVGGGREISEQFMGNFQKSWGVAGSFKMMM